MMNTTSAGFPVRSESAGDVAIIYAGDYLNKPGGERIERECLNSLEEGCRALIIDFRDTELVNSLGVSILLGVIDAVQRASAQLIFSEVNLYNTRLFEMLGLTRYVTLAENVEAALATLQKFVETSQAVGR